ncbi:unnamed protein product [Dimorphilus gyrociliatus]|uniref:14-3-3 domain-containing protein n=1 Tax=Dimorphilus gyrociliatus TaxID=2664684 RepID=A0A7I8VWX6_9ANNE|nr:unnamed protein product [Dimorphilus gyrociliatus]
MKSYNYRFNEASIVALSTDALYVSHQSVRLEIRLNMADLREALLFTAKIAEGAERFDDMLTFMESIVDLGNDLTDEERGLLSLACSEKTMSPIRSWRIIKAILSFESEESHATLANNYLNELADEIRNLTSQTISMICNKLLPNATTAENKAFYYKMAADYNRYRAEIEKPNSQERKEVGEKCLAGYAMASEAAKNLPAYDPVRLGINLNLSVLYSDILDDEKRACEIGREALRSSSAELENANEVHYSLALPIMSILRENLVKWE